MRSSDGLWYLRKRRTFVLRRIAYRRRYRLHIAMRIDCSRAVILTNCFYRLGLLSWATALFLLYVEFTPRIAGRERHLVAATTEPHREEACHGHEATASLSAQQLTTLREVGRRAGVGLFSSADARRRAGVGFSSADARSASSTVSSQRRKIRPFVLRVAGFGRGVTSAPRRRRAASQPPAACSFLGGGDLAPAPATPGRGLHYVKPFHPTGVYIGAL